MSVTGFVWSPGARTRAGSSASAVLASSGGRTTATRPRGDHRRGPDSPRRGGRCRRVDTAARERVESKGRIRSDKGLDFPTTDLQVDPLTPKGLADLDVVARDADIVGYSFVQRPADIVRLQEELRARTSRPLAVSAKIETAHAVRRLPGIIVR
jgi:hypothetical protein